MRIHTLIKQNIIYHWKTHLSLFLGTVLTSAILIGALTVGDSVRESLKKMTLKRLGNTVYGMELKEGYVRAQLAGNIEEKIKTPVAPVLGLTGIVTLDGGKIRTPGVQVYGIDRKFSLLTGNPSAFPGLESGEALINRRLAQKLDLEAGNTFLLRVQNAGIIPLNVLFSDTKGTDTISFRLKVKAVLEDDQLGEFSLRIHQVPSLNVFLPVEDIHPVLKIKGKANMLLIAWNGKKGPSLDAVNLALKETWTPLDAGITLEMSGNSILLRSEKIFINSTIAEAGLQLHPRAEGIFTYFVNEMSSGKRITPYSFVSAPGPGGISASIKDNEIVINEWLARDLEVRPGDKLNLTYFVPGAEDRLDTESSEFTIQKIIPVINTNEERSVVPPFPGLSDASQCRNWDPGIPIDPGKIRDKDEEYWNKYRELPKAYISLASARNIWKNPFGTLTSIRYPADKISIKQIEDSLTGQLDPGSFGFEFLPVREKGLYAGENAVDFGGLFIGLSFFIITASLLLLSMFISIEKEYRAPEFGLLRSMGYSKGKVITIFLIETLIIIICGNLAGMPAGILYNQGVLWGLNSIWKGAVGTSSLTLFVHPATIGTGLLMSLAVTVFTIFAAGWKYFTLPITHLIRAKGMEVPGMKKSTPIRSLVMMLACILPVFLMFFLSLTKIITIDETHFFLSGFLLLGACISFCNLVLSLVKTVKKGKKPNLSSLGVNNLALRKKKSMVTISLLAFGIFVIISVGVFRGKLPQNPELRSSGTGGFRFFVETSLPITRDTSDVLTNQFASATGTSFVFIRVQEGDDASCLNLNYVEKPRVLGVMPDEFAKRGSFSFTEVPDSHSKKNPWLSLHEKQENGIIPAIADQTVITWSLEKKIGDILLIKDESGKDIPVKFVAGLENSVFQGNIIISDEFFKELYPSVSGYRLLLVDVPESGAMDFAQRLEDRLKILGPIIETAEQRLESFTIVENTYLSIFLLLGGIGVLLGSLGFGIIVLRKIMESKQEYAILRAVGFSRLSLFFSVLIENSYLLFSGLACGLFSGIGALLLYRTSQSTNFSFGFILIILTGILISGIIWISVLAITTFSRSLITVLRNE
ncbi:MAG: ABC transporter permease [Spirochaetales bacterium]|nr:ABC transporter permease [Spirochaetales bacterium]